LSNIENPIEGEAEEVSLESGVADAEAEEVYAEEEAEPQYDYLEVDDSIRNKYVSAKVNGEEVPVQFDELVNSYSRESVSTQRFQEAAAIRQEAENALRLQQAMQANPGLTVQYLAQQAGVSVQELLGMQQDQVAAQKAPAVDEDEYIDPLERQIAEQQKAIQQLVNHNEQRGADEYLHRAVGHLKDTYRIDDNMAKAVVGRALQMNAGPEMFPMIFQSMAFEATQQATAQHTAGQEAELQRKRAAAQQAQQVVSSGAGVPASATTSEVTGNFTSIRDAAMAAVEAAGIA